MTNKQWGASAVTNPDYIAEQNEKTKELRLMLEQAQKQELKPMPRKATEEMLKAMDECSMEGYDERLYAGHASSVYMAAWDAFQLTEQARKQEPVAVPQFRIQGCSDWYDGHPDYLDDGDVYETRTLYTSPPQRQPLTHEQRFDLLTKFEPHKNKWEAPAILIDMVEAAHGIKGDA